MPSIDSRLRHGDWPCFRKLYQWPSASYVTPSLLYMQLWAGQSRFSQMLGQILTIRFQYFTWADKAGGSYRKPESEHDPLIEILALEKEKERLGKTQ